MKKLSIRELTLAVLVLAALTPTLARADRRQERTAQTYLPKLEKILTENIVPFWYDKTIDRENGGYTINHDQQGQPLGPGTKMIVSQARTVWLFSRLARAGYRPEEYLEAAEHGYRFLTEKMWDHEHGGFYWQVDATGDQQLAPRKHLYGQSFALYGISEYYLAGGKDEAREFAVRFFNLLEEKAYDQTYGGYRESFEPDWTETPAGVSNHMGVPAELKLMNTHLHLLEALTTFYRATKHPVARERLLELINVQSNTVVRKNIGACTDKYDRDWTPRLDGNYAQVSYGHDIENVWLLMDACNAIGVSNYPFADLYHTLYDYSLTFGYDHAQGGFYYTGSFNEPATNRDKSWWVQAEALASALHMFRFTNDGKYLSVFQKTFGYVEQNMVDWDNGEWHHIITPNGTVQGSKASPWKAGYHNGRAMIECIEILKAWQPR